MSDPLLEEETFVPSLPDFRRAVAKIKKQRDRVIVQCIYLAALRVSELSSKVAKWDLEHNRTKPYGKYLTWKIDVFEKEKLLLMKFAVAKRTKKVQRKGKTMRSLVYKMIALPCNPKYEPWTLDLLKWIHKFGGLNFPLTPQRIGQVVRKELGSIDQKIHTHSLRHYRISHLVDLYGFDPFDITAYSGWTFKTTFGRMGMGSGQLDIYLHMAWKRYFPKLLKEMK